MRKKNGSRDERKGERRCEESTRKKRRVDEMKGEERRCKDGWPFLDRWDTIARGQRT